MALDPNKLRAAGLPQDIVNLLLSLQRQVTDAGRLVRPYVDNAVVVATRNANAAAAAADQYRRVAVQAWDGAVRASEQAEAAADRAQRIPEQSVLDVVEAIGIRKNNFDATRAPLPTDDATQGYAPGSRWLWQEQGQEWALSDATPDAARWLLKSEVTPQVFGAAGTGAVDDTAPLRTTLQRAVTPRRANLGPGTYRVHRADPTGGSGTTPQDWALNPDQPEWIVGNGIDTVLRSQVPNNNVIARVGLLPIGDREPDIIGGGIEGVTFDGAFNAADPAARVGWSDTGTMTLWASGVQDWTLRNVKSINSSDYGIGLQNGRHRRMRIRDVVIDNTMNDAIDLKNNYGRGRDNSMMGVWASRFGQANDLQFPFAGIDLMAPRWIMSHIWATEWGQAGDCQAGIRFKQGEAGESRDMGAYKAILYGFHVETLAGGYLNTVGVDSRHRRNIVALGTIEGTYHAGVDFLQERGLALGLDIQGRDKTAGAGIWAKPSSEATQGDYLLSAASRVWGYAAGLRLDRNGGIHIGHHLKGNSRAVTAAGDDNVVLAWSEDNGTLATVTDTRQRNWIGLWEAGKLNVYRQGKVRYSFGDVIESTADLSTLIGRMQTTGGGGWLETTAPSASTGYWTYNTNGAFAWQRNGANLLRIDGNQVQAEIPLRIKKYSVNSLPAAGTVADGAVIYCTNGDAGQPCLAVYDGTNWRRVPLGAAVSATS